MLTANSDKNDIPVIFNNIAINWLLMLALFVIDCISSIIPVNLSIIRIRINTPVNKLMYIANSGRYCFSSIIITVAIIPIAMIFTISILVYFTSGYRLNSVLTVSNSPLISFITIVSTITSPASVVIIA